MSFYKFRRLTYSKWQRISRWEFWPAWLFYIPIVIYIFWLAIKYRGATLFSIANPKMGYGGIFGDDKSSTLDPLAKVFPRTVPQSFYLKGDAIEQFAQFQALVFNYPMVLKPNSGYRGAGVKIISDFAQAEDYFRTFENEQTIAQEYIAGKEYGVFYIRQPDLKHGFVYSIVEKTFPEVIGDGRKSLQELILSDHRAVMMAPVFLQRHNKKLTKILDNGEEFKLVEVGSHCRGSVFLDANHLISDTLAKKLDELLEVIPEYYFGRLDLRCPDESSLQQAKNLKILEINGVTSEAASIYDPENSILTAYKVMFKQWDWAFKIGKLNQKRGYQPISLLEIIKRWIRGKTNDKSKRES